jgi:hypothetical protein
VRLIRVRETNANAIIQALKNAGHQAEVVSQDLMPAPDVWCYRSYPGSDWYQEQLDLAEMVKGQVPLQISCSGKQANKIISQLKKEGVI